MAIPTWYSSIQPQIYILVGSEASKQRECSFSSSYIATWTSENVSGHQRFRQPISPDLSHLSKKITFFFSSRKLFFSLTTCREFGTLISKKKNYWFEVKLAYNVSSSLFITLGKIPGRVLLNSVVMQHSHHSCLEQETERLFSPREWLLGSWRPN